MLCNCFFSFKTEKTVFELKNQLYLFVSTKESLLKL